MHITSLFGKLSNFRYFLYGFLGLSFIFLLFLVFKKKINIIDKIKYFIKPSSILYILVFIYLYYTLANTQVSKMDDFHMWGRKLEDMNNRDYFYYDNTNSDMGVISQRILPFMIQYALIKLFGSYNISYAFLTMSSFTLSFFFSLLDKYEFNIKDIIKSLITLFIIILTTLMVQSNEDMIKLINQTFIYNSLYRDWLVSIITAYIFYRIIKFEKDDKFSYLETSIYFITLLLSKEITPVFVLLLIFTLVVKLLINKELKKKEIINICVYLVLIPCAYYGLYKYQVSLFTVSSTSSVSIDFSNFFSGYRLEVISKFINEYFNTPIMTRPFSISYFYLSIILTLVIWLFGKFINKSKDIRCVSIIYFLGSVGYALALLLSYLTMFSSYEALGLAMYCRYMETYTYIGLVLIIYLLLDYINNYIYLGVVALVSIILVEPNGVNSILISGQRQTYKAKEEESLREYFENEYDGWNKILVINQTDTYYRAVIRYAANIYSENLVTDQISESDSYEDFKEKILSYNYLIIGDYDDLFFDYWMELYNEPPTNNTIYSLYTDEEGNNRFAIIYFLDK